MKKEKCIQGNCEYFKNEQCQVKNMKTFKQVFGFSPCYVGGVARGSNGSDFKTEYGDEFSQLILKDSYALNLIAI